ncbi:DUF2878 domain-containing protein [Pseudobowmanella zhangzhouensis]|uniref:DUF2878 domain-containing protein n=1 Tax=Pseudobowmanella zhangzhouensis TaxID=1537679 RepID=A0ABW1XK30_9ALTE
MPHWRDVVINALLFQGLWFAAILSGWQWALLPLGLMLVHVIVISERPWQVLAPLIPAFLLGGFMDAMLHGFGVFAFEARQLEMQIAGLPLFLAIIWLGFLLTLPVSLKRFVTKPRWFVLMCALLAPLSYRAGAALGAVQLSEHWLWYLVPLWAFFGWYLSQPARSCSL